MEDYKNTPEGKEAVRLYGDIISLSRPKSPHPQMDLTQRAKIFSPYDALRGFDEEIDSTDEKAGRESRILLSEEMKNELSDKLSHIEKGAGIKVRYFAADADGLGKYTDLYGIVSRIDPVFRILEITKEPEDSEDTGKIEKLIPAVIHFDDLIDISLSKFTDISP